MVGLSRNLKLQWLNKVVELVLEGHIEQEIKDLLNEYLSFEIQIHCLLRLHLHKNKGTTNEFFFRRLYLFAPLSRKNKVYIEVISMYIPTLDPKTVGKVIAQFRQCMSCSVLISY